MILSVCFFFQAEDGIRDGRVTGVQTCALPISGAAALAQVTSDARRKARSGPNRRQSPSAPDGPWPADMPERLRAARMPLVRSGYGTVPRGTTHRAGCPMIFAQLASSGWVGL